MLIIVFSIFLFNGDLWRYFSLKVALFSFLVLVCGSESANGSFSFLVLYCCRSSVEAFAHIVLLVLLGVSNNVVSILSGVDCFFLSGVTGVGWISGCFVICG